MVDLFYRRRSVWACILVACLWCLPVAMLGQDRKRLEDEKKRIEQEIASINKLLSETQKTKRFSLSELGILKKKILARETLVKNLNRQILLLNGEITTTQQSITSLQNEITVLKREYRGMLQIAYRHRSILNKMLFIFDAPSFNLAWQRFAFFRQYGNRQMQRLETIRKREDELSKRNNELEIKKLTQEGLLGQEIRHKDQLASEEKTKQQWVRDLQKKEKNLAKQIREKNQLRKRLQRQIDAAIAKEIARQKELAAKKAAKKSKNAPATAATSEEVLLSRNFAGNKGKLPLPTSGGVITGQYGVHPHPELKGIEIENLGIDVRTATGGQARSVFDGEVCQIMSGPNGKKVVIIRHGEYLTVYTNLEKVFVRVGAKVATMQPIGEVAANEDKVSEINFQIWKGNQRQNPAAWIRN